MAEHYKCPHCTAYNQVLNFSDRISRNLPAAVTTVVVSALSLGLGAVVGIAAAAYQYIDGYGITCHNCYREFKVRS